MTNALAAGYKAVGNPLQDEEQIVKFRYDFAADGGATTVVIQMGKALQDLIVTHFHVVCHTAGTSGGSATITLGTTTDVAKFVGATAGAVANLTLAAVLGPDTAENVPYRWISGDYLILTIGTAALTAGVFDVYLKVMKP